MAVVVVNSQLPAAAAADHQIFPAVAIDIEPRDARPQLAESIGQQWLASEIIEQFVGMRVRDQFTDICEQRGRLVRIYFELRLAGLLPLRDSRSFGGSSFINFIDPTGLCRSHNAVLPAAPTNV